MTDIISICVKAPSYGDVVPPVITLKQVKLDPVATKSLMTVDKAKKTRGRTLEVPADEGRLKGEHNQHYHSREKIVLTWWQEGAGNTQTEEFFIVDECSPGIEAVLRGALKKKLQDLDDIQHADLSPLEFPPQSSNDKKKGKERDEKDKKDSKGHQARNDKEYKDGVKDKRKNDKEFKDSVKDQRKNGNT